MRERILPNLEKWSPYPHGNDSVLTACRDIERDASFFMGTYGDEAPPLPPMLALTDEQKRAIRDTKPNEAPKGSFVILASNPRVRYDVVKPLEHAPTEPVSQPYEALEIVPSDGVPLPIGDDESTVPNTPPKGSTLVYTESAHEIGMRW